MEKEDQIYIQDKTTQLFSRGILAKRLELIGFSLSEGYEFSMKVHNDLIELNKDLILIEELDEIVYNNLKTLHTKKAAEEYRLVENWKRSQKPLWILLAGAIGVGKSTVARQIAGDLGIQHVIGTDVVRDILRKILSADVMPELHAPSYRAYQTLRPIYSSRFEEVILGFESHSKYVNVGVDAILSRAETESVSIVVEGEHLLPAFFDEIILSKPNVLYLTLLVESEELHKDNLSAQYTQEKEDLLSHFEEIRKIHGHLIDETRKRRLPLIESRRGKSTINQIRKLIVKKIVSLK